jgi:LacI family transcriptional regulator, fructose operon transcriptional repressor
MAWMKNRTSRRTTIYDIASEARTSSSTVSLVLNGSWRRYRIRPETAERVLSAAETLGYNVNMRARGLRLARSNLAGMIIPHYRNRFFAGLAETFEAEARARNLCPIVVSTQSEPATERRVLEALLAQQVEFIFVTGVHRPEPLNDLCRSAGVPCVNLDLPGNRAPSVVTDNREGAYRLTLALLEAVQSTSGAPEEIRFIGGRSGEYATEGRVAGFAEALGEHGVAASRKRILPCGYAPEAAQAVFDQIVSELGHAPSGLFVNSITALEGVTNWLRMRGRGSCSDMIVCCFDWDPFAAALPLRVIMLRQDIERLIGEAFHLLDAKPGETPALVLIPPTLSVPNAAPSQQIGKTNSEPALCGSARARQASGSRGA